MMCIFRQRCTIKGKVKIKVPILNNERMGRSWSRALGSQPAGDMVHSHKPGGRLPLLSTRPAFTFPAKEHHRYQTILLSYRHMCVNNLPTVYLTAPRLGVDFRTFRSPVWPVTVMGCLHDPPNVQQFTCILNTFVESLLDVCWIV